MTPFISDSGGEDEEESEQENNEESNSNQGSAINKNLGDVKSSEDNTMLVSY